MMRYAACERRACAARAQLPRTCGRHHHRRRPYEIFEMRKFLEGPAAELAAGRLDARHLAPLKGAAQALQAKVRGKNWTSQWADFDDLFHTTIAHGVGTGASPKISAVIGCCTRDSIEPQRN